MSKPKVFLTGGEGNGWALDEDLGLTRAAIRDRVEWGDFRDSDIVHAVWWESLLSLPVEELIGKPVVCHVPAEPYRYMSLPAHIRAMNLVTQWVTRTLQAYHQLESIGVASRLIPYLIDVTTFRPLDDAAEIRKSFCRRWRIPNNSYLIGSFQRDTEGSDLSSPKLTKGPDVLLEIVRTLVRKSTNIHVILVGPRRHWLIAKFREHEIPSTYIGREVEFDDLEINMLPRAALNVLYNVVDLCLVTSRSEGGPHSLLEAAAVRCKILSPPVGTAPDTLEPDSLFHSPADSVERIQADIRLSCLDKTVNPQYRRVHERHVPGTAGQLFQSMYESLDNASFDVRRISKPRSKAAVPGTRDCVDVCNSSSNELTVGIWHTFFQPPYGGGNQFMLALKKALDRLGVNIIENELCKSIDAYILNSIHFDVDRFREMAQSERMNVIHRIDGPIHLIRGFDREKDELCFNLNAEFASATVLQSAWTFQRIVEMGYKPQNPIIIHNAADPIIFHARGRDAFRKDRKIRLISTSWSNNPRKGGSDYKWLEDHLDWDRFDYTFVGNLSEELKKARHLEPVSSGELAKILRDHDIYITASRNDPCSNALIEALACGLPALYLNDGGHSELVGYGGLPFETREEILPQLERIVENYETFRNLLTPPRLDDVALKYVTLIREVLCQ